MNGCAMILKTKKEFIFQGDCFMKALSSNERLLILINCFYNLANAMSAVFMNVYLYAYTGSLVPCRCSGEQKKRRPFTERQAGL